MARIDLDLKPQNGDNTREAAVQNGTNEEITLNDNETSKTANDPSVTSSGMTMEEVSDPNKITVTIADDETPIVVLFGPKSCGKTMTLVRLTRYLKANGYTVEPVKSFRPAHDRNYKNMCDNYNTMVNSEDAAESTSKINFMLVKVLNGAKPLCQILEGPGEYYFDSKSPNANFPKFVNAIINSCNRKIWAVIVEPDTASVLNHADRKNYADKVSRLKVKMKPRDKVIFLFNKIDETHFVVSPGNINSTQAVKHIAQTYQGIFSHFRNQNPITRLWRKYLCDFVAFQTGDFSTADDGTLTYQEGDDSYPRNLWNVILKRIRG